MIDMEKSTLSFSLKRIISNDYSSSLSVGFVLVYWILYTVYDYIGYMHVRGIGFVPFTGETFSIQQESLLLITLFGVSYFVWRVHLFHRLYKRGLEVSGIITYIGGSRVDYEYLFQNTKYSSGNAVSNNLLKKRNYHKGDEMVLLVDPEKPKNAVIKDIYF